MPCSIRPYRRFPVHCAVTYKAGPFLKLRLAYCLGFWSAHTGVMKRLIVITLLFLSSAPGQAEWVPLPMPDSMLDVLAEYERQSAEVLRRWEALPQSKWDGSLQFFGSERPASPMAWSFLFDIVHHRGQITTYLRPMGSTVPQIYGPSADEP